jgi:hypothetical protein
MVLLEIVLVPLCVLVVGEKLYSPEKNSVPAPFLVRLPLAETVAADLSVTPLSVVMVPPPTPMRMPRLACRANVFSAPVAARVARSVPPFKISESGFALPGTAPKLLSALIDSVPPKMVVLPE